MEDLKLFCFCFFFLFWAISIPCSLRWYNSLKMLWASCVSTYNSLTDKSHTSRSFWDWPLSTLDWESGSYEKHLVWKGLRGTLLKLLEAILFIWEDMRLALKSFWGLHKGSHLWLHLYLRPFLLAGPWIWSMLWGHLLLWEPFAGWKDCPGPFIFPLNSAQKLNNSFFSSYFSSHILSEKARRSQ